MSDLPNFDYLDRQQNLDNMTDNIFANEWMPSWEETSAAAATYNHYSPGRKLTDDEMFEFCMSGIANVEDFLRSKPSPMFMSNNDFDAGGDQDVAVTANGVDTEAEDVLAAIATYNNGAVYDAPLETNAPSVGWVNDEHDETAYKETSFFASAGATNNPAQGVTSATTEPTGDNEAKHRYDTTPFANGGNAGSSYAPAAVVDPFSSDFNPFLNNVFASMNAKGSYGGLEDVADPNTFPTSTTALDNVAGTSDSAELVAAEAATVTEPGVKHQVLVDSENAPQAAHVSEDDLSANLGDFPDFPEFDDVAISPTTLSHKTYDTTSRVTTADGDHIAATKAHSTVTADVETPVNAPDSTFNHSAVGRPKGQDYKLDRSTSSPARRSAYAPNSIAPDTVGSTSNTSTATRTSPKTPAASSNTSPASSKSASFSNKYVSPFVSDEEDLFAPMESFEDFLSSHSSPTHTTAATPSAKPAVQDAVDLTADTPKTAYFPSAAPRSHAPMPAQPSYSSRMSTQPSYTPTMPTKQYHTASPYLNTSATAAPQKAIWEMSDAEVASWLATAGVPPVSAPVPTPAASMPGLESPHYASTELPQAPYTSPMPRKRKASSVSPDQMPKKARVESSRPIAQPHRRRPANGIPANYSWLTSTAASTAPPSSSGSDPAPLLAFTIGGKVQGCTRVSDEQWAKMYDSALVNGGRVRMKGARWARLYVTGRVKEIEGVNRGVVAVVME